MTNVAGWDPGSHSAADMPVREKIGIRLTILRRGQSVFAGQTSVEQMARSFRRSDRVAWSRQFVP